MVNGTCVGKAVGEEEGDAADVESLNVDSPQTISKNQEKCMHVYGNGDNCDGQCLQTLSS